MHIARRTPVADIQRFSNRMQAGRLLAGQLGACAGRADMLALALPRGGVPVGYAMAQALGIALDVLVVRKLGMPRHEEYAMGALGSGGVRVLQPGIPGWMGITKQDVDRVSARELAELARRERVYRGARAPLALHGRSAILVDDGVATGSTMLAAIAVARLLQPSTLALAIPVAPADTAATLAAHVDALVCLRTPPLFRSVGQWYDDFGQTSDQEVQDLLALAWHAHGETRETRNDV
jgi:putative phosphoribosyl transferase